MATDSNVKIVLAARDDTKAAFDSAGKNLAGLQDAVTGLPAKFGAVGLAVAGAFEGASIKGAIDLGDRLDDLSEKTGITVEKLGALRYAGEVTGTPLDALATGVRKLSVNMAAAAGGGKEQAAIFASLGVSVKALDGSLRGSDQVLGDIADRFASFKDGPEKTALAIQIFGKAGADMIPVLNKGSAGIADLNKEAEKLGVIFSGDLAASAAAFNDNLKKIQLSAEASKVTIAGALLPTLNELSAGFIESRDGGKSFAAMLGTGLAESLKTVVVVAADVTYGLKAIGTEIGGIVAQFAAMGEAGGVFTQAGRNAWSAVGAAMREDAARARKEIDDFQTRIMTSGQAMAGSGRGAAPDPRILGATESIKAQTEAWKINAPVVKAAGDAASAAADEFGKLYDKIIGKKVGLDADFTKNLATLKAGLDGGRIARDDYIKTVAAYIAQQPFAVAAAKAGADALEALTKAATKTAQERQAARLKESDGIADWLRAQSDASAAVLASVKDRAQSLKDESAAVALSTAQNISLASAIEQVTISRLEEQQAGLQAGSDAYDAITREISARRTLVKLIDTQDLRRRESAGWTDLFTSLDATAHDVFVNMFESGSNAFKRLGQTLKASVIDLLYQMVARPFIISVGAAVLGSGFATAASAAAGAGVAGTFASSALGATLFAGSSLAAIGSSIGSGFMATVSGQSIGAAAGAYSAAGQTGVAAGLQVGAAIPYVAAAVGLASALGLFRSTKTVGTGIMGTVGETNNVTAYDLNRKSGYLFGGPDYSIKSNALDADTTKSINDSLSLISSSSKAYAQALGLSIEALTGFSTALGSDLIHPATGGIGIDLTGLSSDQAVAKINAELAKVGDAYAQQLIGTFADVTTSTTAAADVFVREWDLGMEDFVQKLVTRAGTVTTTVANTYQPSEFAKTGETAGATLARLATSLVSVNALFDGMGKTLLTASLAGGNMASQLLDAFGGLENASTRLTSYYNNFYSEDERVANTTRLLTASLADLGQTLPATRDAFRAIVDAQDVTTESGRNTFAALVGLSDAFASIVPAASAAQTAVESTAKTLEQIATERTGLEDSLLTLLGESATLRQRELAALDPSNRALKEMAYAVQDAQSAIGGLTSDIARLDNIAAQASGLSATIAQALGGADTSTQTLWATVNSATATAEARLGAVGELIALINGSIAQDTAAAQKTLTDGANAAQKEIAKTNAAQIAALQTQVASAERLRDLGRQLRDYVQDIRLGNSSALTPAQKLAYASAQYSASLAGAQAGDALALSGLQGNASKYLELASAYDPAAYNQIFDSVTTTLDSLGGSLMSEGAQAAATAAAQLTSLQAISAAATSAATEALTGNVISAANQQALTSLLGVTTQIEAQAAIDRAAAQAQVTLENARMDAIRASLSDAGLLATSATNSSATLAGMAASQATASADLLAEIKALNDRLAALEATTVQVAAAQIDTAVTVGAQTATALADGLSTAGHASTLMMAVV